MDLNLLERKMNIQRKSCPDYNSTFKKSTLTDLVVNVLIL